MISAAYEWAQSLGIVPEWQAVYKDSKSYDEAADRFRKALKQMQEVLGDHVRARRFIPDPGPEPPKHEMEPLPDAKAPVEEQIAFGRRQEQWMIDVYWPVEPERIVWGVVAGEIQRRRLDRRAKLLAVGDTLRTYGPPVGIAAAGIAALVWALVSVWA